jgi:hypothetical protein
MLYLLVFCIFLSIQGYYFGFIRPPAVLAWLSQATFVTSTFLLTPFLVFALVNQAGAIERLEETGLQPHPGIIESVGIANGQGDQPTWVFAVRANSRDIREFYTSTANIGDWSFEGDDGLYMRFTKDGMEMKIAHQDGHTSDTLIYMLEKQ